MISIIASIQPKWCELIVSGKKTIEVRKTAPKETPFKVYMYCTKAKEYFSLGGGVYACRDSLYKMSNGTIQCGDGFEEYAKDIPIQGLNGKVIGEFVCDKVSLEIPSYKDGRGYWGYCDLINGSCLTLEELDIYGKNQVLYGWHVSNLIIYDEPKELSEFYHYCGDEPTCKNCNYYYYCESENGTEEECMSPIECFKPITRPPQSWMYCEEVNE